MRNVKRATVNLDARLLEQAAAALGTSGTTATLNGALERIVREQRLASLAERRLPDLDLDGLEQRRRWRGGG